MHCMWHACRFAPPLLTANGGPARIQYICLVPIFVLSEMKLLFPKQNYNILSPSSYTQIPVRDLRVYISRIGLPILLQGNMGGELGIYKSLTDTLLWKLGLRPRNSHKRNTYMWFSLQCSLVGQLRQILHMSCNTQRRRIRREIRRVAYMGERVDSIKVWFLFYNLDCVT